MAQSILDNIYGKTLVVTGNLHSRTRPFYFDKSEKEIKHPMGEYLKLTIPNVLNIDITYKAGKYYNIKEKVFIDSVEQESELTLKYTKNKYILELNYAHSAIVPV
jgi:hypothetical protein